jgi:hypothetical protein
MARTPWGLFPDPAKHKRISLIKSYLRIAGYAILVWVSPVAAIMLAVAELLGIYEEMV